MQMNQFEHSAIDENGDEDEDKDEARITQSKERRRNARRNCWYRNKRQQCML